MVTVVGLGFVGLTTPLFRIILFSFFLPILTDQLVADRNTDTNQKNYR